MKKPYFDLKIFVNLDISNLFPDHLDMGKFIQSKFGNAILMDKAGFVYKTKSKIGKKIYWICRESDKKQIDKSSRCKARAITTDGIHIKTWKNEHNHEPPTKAELQEYIRKYGVKKDPK